MEDGSTKSIENVKVGDKVVMPTMGFTKLNFEGEEYFIGKEREILGRITK